MKILANDGIDAAGKNLLEKAGHTVDTNKIPQEELASKIADYDVIIVRSATTVTREIIESGKLKVIGRAGVGTDNIDKVAAKEKNVEVINTPAASSISVAELVFAHLFGLVRFLQKSNRKMPNMGMTKFKELKKEYSTGSELKGKTMGIVGFGRIGQETAKIALGVGMKVLAYDPFVKNINLDFTFHSGMNLPKITVPIETVSIETLLKESDFISLHVPKLDKPAIGEAEIAMMKTGAGIVNCARGGVVDEKSLAKALENGKIAFAGIDVFENEPPVNDILLKQDNASLTPHCGASTNEAQERIGIELAEKIIHFLK
ncbi:MAG: D-2-hydroxyacid dehydrogenase [Bacteroidia bacterium]|nr:D-2-hydroxyacid dehydrogenase [Bacteroidia bacterium]MCO5252752.1 D-2-hydroxyacid dehydrogenase [Bacteroidota bacterium]